jgi:hypothetical protein
MQFHEPSVVQAPVNAPSETFNPVPTGAAGATGVGSTEATELGTVGAAVAEVARVVGEAAPAVTKTPPGMDGAAEGATIADEAGAADGDGEEPPAAAWHCGLAAALLAGCPIYSTDGPGLGYCVS